LEKKTAQNDMARAALVKVQKDMKTEAIKGTSTGGVIGNGPDTIPQVEDDMFQLSQDKFDDLFAQLIHGRRNREVDSEIIDPLTSPYVTQYTSRYAHAGFRHWQAQFLGTFHDRNGTFFDIKFANQIYRVIDFGKVSDMRSLANFNGKGVSTKSTYVFPLGYKCLRTLVLCLVPREDIDRSRVKKNDSQYKAIQGPEAYPHLEVEFVSEIVSRAVNSVDPSPYVLRISIGNDITVVETPITHPGKCKDAWLSCLKESTGPKIIRALGAPLRRCRAVLNRLCTLPFIMPFLECIPVTNQKASLAYYTAITAPMWLREVHNRLDQGTYEYVYDFAWDVRLVFTNCFEYNLAGSALYEAAVNALKFFEVLMCQWVHNVRDISITDLAKGPWDLWMHLKYFDGHTNISSTLEREVNITAEESPTSRRSTEAPSETDVNRCCVTNAVGSSKKPLLFCESCEDSYHPDVPEAKEGENREKMWYCRRCVISPDWELCVNDPNVLLICVPKVGDCDVDVGETKMEIEVGSDASAKTSIPPLVMSNTAASCNVENSVSSGVKSMSGSSCTIDRSPGLRYQTADLFYPAPELGLGWCATKKGGQQKFLSPLGYCLSNSLEVYRHYLDEVETCNDLLEARKNEFSREHERLATSKKFKPDSKKKRNCQIETHTVDSDTDSVLSTGKIAVFDNFECDVCVWMGFVGEVEDPERAYLPSARVQLQEAQMALKQSKMVTSTNISSLFSAWGSDPQRKIFLTVLNLDEQDYDTNSGKANTTLSTAGLTGLDEPAIHFCIEGLDGLDKMLSTSRPPILGSHSFSATSHSYEYMYAAAVLAELQNHIKRVRKRRIAMKEVF
jgi:hypothetical protein